MTDRFHLLCLLGVFMQLACSRLKNDSDATVLNCGLSAHADGHFVQVFDPNRAPMMGSQLTGTVLESGVILEAIDFSSKGCFQAPERGTVIIRSKDLKLSRTVDATELPASSNLILQEDDAPDLFPSEPLSDKRVYFGQTFYFVDPGYTLNFYSDDNLKNFEIEYCLDEIHDPDAYDFDAVNCPQPKYYFRDDLPRIEQGLWSVRYRKRTNFGMADWSRYLLAVRIDCEGVLYNLETLGESRCTDIDNVTIKGPGSLEKLKYLSRVTGYLEIKENDSDSLHGLRNISSVGDLRILDMTSLKTLDIPPMSINGTVFLTRNNVLEDLDGLAHLAGIERDLQLSDNSALKSVAGLCNIRSIGGDLIIEDNARLENLDALSQLESIGGQLRIYFSESLQSLKGLDRLRRVGSLKVGHEGSNSNSLEGLNHLERVDGDVSLHNLMDNNLEVFSRLEYIGNQLLIQGGNITTLRGLRNLKYLKGLSIERTKLSTIDAFLSLEELDASVMIDDNSKLVSIDGLRNMKRIGGDLRLSGNPLLTSLADFAQLRAIGRELSISSNETLTTLDGLNGLRSVESLSVWNNSALVNLDPILSIESVKEQIYIDPFALCQTSNFANHAGKPVALYCSQPPPVPELVE